MFDEPEPTQIDRIQQNTSDTARYTHETKEAVERSSQKTAQYLLTSAGPGLEELRRTAALIARRLYYIAALLFGILMLLAAHLAG